MDIVVQTRWATSMMCVENTIVLPDLDIRTSRSFNILDDLGSSPFIASSSTMISGSCISAAIIATGVELHSGHEFEMRLWEQIVHKIDPSLKICNIDGLLFKNDQDLQTHMKTHQVNPAMGMGMMGMGMMGIMGMGMMMPGMWI